jgi:4-azaleucine resistance transporter AzlC
MESRSDGLPRAFKASIPVLLGYVPIAFGFGLLTVNTGYPAWFAVFMSVFVYAGAAQYIGIGMFAAGASLAEIALVTLIANIRHAAYGISLITRFSEHPRIKPYLVFALTDETYALLSSAKPEDRTNGSFLLGVSALNQAYWVSGTALGALVGSFLPYRIEGLSFALTAMFLAITTEQAMKLKRPAPFIIAGISTIAARILLGERWTILAGLIASSLVLAFSGKRSPKEADNA